MKFLATVFTATLFIHAASVQAEECYDKGTKYKSKSALRRSKQKDFGFEGKCIEKMNAQKTSIFSVASSKKNGRGLDLSEYLSPEEKKDMNVWLKLEQLKQHTRTKNVKFPVLSWWQPVRENHIRALTKYGSRKFWNFNVGTEDSFTAQVRPFVGFFASRVEAAGEAGVELEGSMMGVWSGKMGSARSVAFSPGTGPLSVDLQIFGPDGKQIWNKNLFRKFELKFEKDMQQRIGVDTIWRFAIGPVPMAAEVGAIGTVGVKNSLALYPLQVSAWGKPYISAETYVMAGADMWLFGSGAGGQLKLASDEVLFRGRSFVDYNEEPTIRLETNVDNDLTLLSGNIFAYVYLKLPLMKKKWMGKFTIFDWDGISMDKNLLSSALVLKKDKTMAFGDVDNSDQALMNRIANGDSDFSIQAMIENKIGEFSVYENENDKIAGTNKRLAGYIR